MPLPRIALSVMCVSTGKAGMILGALAGGLSPNTGCLGSSAQMTLLGQSSACAWLAGLHQHRPFFSFHIGLDFFLEYNCFIMLCQFLLYNEVNQLYVYIYPISLELLFHPTPNPTPLGHHRALN